jgi:hypothetical protein
MRVRSVAPLSSEESPNTTMDKTPRAVIPGSRLFNTLFGSASLWKEFHEIFGSDPKRLPSGWTCPFVR